MLNFSILKKSGTIENFENFLIYYKMLIYKTHFKIIYGSWFLQNAEIQHEKN